MWLCKNLCFKGRLQLKCFLVTIISSLKWRNMFISTHTHTAVDTEFQNGHGFTPFPRTVSHKGPKCGFSFPFFLQSTTLYKKKNTSKAIPFSHTFQGSIWDPHLSSLSNYVIKAEVFGLLWGFKDIQGKTRNILNYLFYATHFPGGELESTLPALSLNSLSLQTQKVRSES